LLFKVDESGVPSDKLNDPRLRKIEGRLGDCVSDKKRRRCTCIHEAAHLVYAKRTGAIDSMVRGPAILYNAQSDTFGGSLAAVLPVFPQEIPQESTELGVTRMHAAGCVAECLLTDSGDPESGCLDFEKLGSSKERRKERPAQSSLQKRVMDCSRRD
jgi:hypothetical protein